MPMPTILTGNRFSSWVLCSLLLISCQSKEAINPYSDRVNVYIPALVSYTADYSLMPVPFDSLGKLILADPHVDMDKQSQLDKRRVRSTKYQNPVLPVPQPQLSEFTVTGEVERISYEPVSEVERRIAAYAFLGLIGLEIFGDAGAMAAYTQYWFSIKDSNDKVLDSFVVIGASSAHPQKKSRKELMTEANYIAAVNFASELAFRIAKLKDLTLEHLPSTYYPLDIRILMYKNYFGLKLKSTEVR